MKSRANEVLRLRLRAAQATIAGLRQALRERERATAPPMTTMEATGPKSFMEINAKGELVYGVTDRNPEYVMERFKELRAEAERHDAEKEVRQRIAREAAMKRSVDVLRGGKA